ncbi:MAG: MerR family transcriptional regulator [Candidatus Ventricola sp.]
MTIRQVCSQYGLSPDTLRYYEKVGVIPEVHRTASGIRDYDEAALSWVENAVCMRSAGVPVESIIEYVRLYQAGDETLEARRDLLKNVHNGLLEQRRQMDAAIDRLSYKIRRYDAALKTGVLSWEEEDAK